MANSSFAFWNFLKLFFKYFQSTGRADFYYYIWFCFFGVFFWFKLLNLFILNSIIENNKALIIFKNLELEVMADRVVLQQL